MIVEDVVCHHLTACRKEETMKLKIFTRTYSENNMDKLRTWYNDVFLGWPNNRNMRELHPTNAQAYEHAFKLPSDAEFPEILKIHPYYNMDIVR